MHELLQRLGRGDTRLIEMCRQAQSEGWGGDWSWRIQQLNKKRYEKGPGVKAISSSGLTPL